MGTQTHGIDNAGRGTIRPSGADVVNAIIGLGELADTTFATDAATASAVASAVTVETAARKNVKRLVIAGADNTVTHDYALVGVTAASTVFAAVAYKDQATVAAAITGTITPGTDIITVAAGADLSVAFTLVFQVWVA